jgi:hypothetical protein
MRTRTLSVADAGISEVTTGFASFIEPGLLGARR